MIRGAAPRVRRRLALVALATSALTGAAPIAAHVDGSPRSMATTPTALWAVALDAKAAGSFTRDRATLLRRSGVNAVVLAGWPQPSAAARQKAAAAALASGLFVVTPDYARSVASAGGACAGERPGYICAVFASSVRQGAALANVPGSGIVVVRLAGPGQLRVLAARHTRRIVAVVPLQVRRRFDSVQWLKATRLVGAASMLDLAVQPVGPKATPALASYLRLLGASSGTGTKAIASAQPPSAPAKVAAAGATVTSVTLSWGAADDAVEYGIYRDGARIGRAVGQSFVVAGLACDTSYAFAVDPGVGTLGGYSTIWLARALPPDGRLITLEADAAYAEVARAPSSEPGSRRRRASGRPGAGHTAAARGERALRSRLHRRRQGQHARLLRLGAEHSRPAA